MKRYQFIEAEEVAVRRSCALLGVSKSAYYEWHRHVPSSHQLKDQELTSKVEAIHAKSRGTYGAPRVHRDLEAAGVRCGRKRVARLMAEKRLVGRYKRRSMRTTIADGQPGSELEDRLKRSFQPALFDLNEVWVGDITYLRTHEGWTYLATVIDLASRKVVGFAMADHMRASLVCKAMEMALKARNPKAGLINHTDRGSQYTSAEYRRLLAQHGVIQSFSRPRQCWDNAVAESFFSTLKTELIHTESWPTRRNVMSAVFEYIEVFYNRQRRHSSISYLTPAAFEELRSKLPKAAPAA